MKPDKKTKLFSVLSFVFPSIAVILAIGWLIFALIAGSLSSGWLVFFGSIFLMVALAVAAPLGGICGLIFSILALKHGAKKPRQMAAMVYSILMLLAGIPFILMFL